MGRKISITVIKRIADDAEILDFARDNGDIPDNGDNGDILGYILFLDIGDIPGFKGDNLGLIFLFILLIFLLI